MASDTDAAKDRGSRSTGKAVALATAPFTAHAGPDELAGHSGGLGIALTAMQLGDTRMLQEAMGGANSASNNAATLARELGADDCASLVA